MVTLRPIDDSNRAEVEALRVSTAQQQFVANVADSLLEAAAEPDGRALYWAVYANETPVGFVMIAWDVDPTEGLIGPWFLWKLAIDRDHQRRGYGQAVVDAIVEIVRTNGGTELYTSYVDEAGGPKDFYARLGFVPAGDHGGEVLVVKAV